MKKYDVHIHTYHSKCSGNTKLKRILKKAKQKGLSGIAVTDHNTIKGALELKRLNKDKDFKIIVGEEIKTDVGHVLAYYLKKEIKPGKLSRVIKDIKKQKAIGVLAHPFNYPHPVKQATAVIAKLIGIKHKRASVNLTPENVKLVKKLDAIEGFNSRCMLKKENKDAQKLASKFNLPVIAGSDGHFLWELGNAYVKFEDELSLRQAIKKRELRIKGRHSNFILVKICIALNLIKKLLIRG
ncbi:PHP domain-containing protein [Candidatus Woesearchaeota archaeon]|nr:PHP domain-containing protein [Candidatus Woesearchaeota archaeon]